MTEIACTVCELQLMQMTQSFPPTDLRRLTTAPPRTQLRTYIRTGILHS